MDEDPWDAAEPFKFLDANAFYPIDVIGTLQGKPQLDPDSVSTDAGISVLTVTATLARMEVSKGEFLTAIAAASIASLGGDLSQFWQLLFSSLFGTGSDSFKEQLDHFASDPGIVQEFTADTVHEFSVNGSPGADVIVASNESILVNGVKVLTYDDDMENVTINAGQGDDTIYIESNPKNTVLTVNAGEGNDQIIVDSNGAEFWRYCQ